MFPFIPRTNISYHPRHLMIRWALFLIFAKPPFFTQLLPHIWGTASIYYFWVWENLKQHPPPRYYLNNVVKEYRARMQRRQQEKWNCTLEIHRGSCVEQPAYTIMNSPKCTVPGRQRIHLSFTIRVDLELLPFHIDLETIQKLSYLFLWILRKCCFEKCLRY